MRPSSTAVRGAGQARGGGGAAAQGGNQRFERPAQVGEHGRGAGAQALAGLGEGDGGGRDQQASEEQERAPPTHVPSPRVIAGSTRI